MDVKPHVSFLLEVSLGSLVATLDKKVSKL